MSSLGISSPRRAAAVGAFAAAASALALAADGGEFAASATARVTVVGAAELRPLQGRTDQGIALARVRDSGADRVTLSITGSYETGTGTLTLTDRRCRDVTTARRAVVGRPLARVRTDAGGNAFSFRTRTVRNIRLEDAREAKSLVLYGPKGAARACGSLDYITDSAQFR